MEPQATTDPATSITPGDGTAIVGERTFALFGSDPGGPLPQALAQLVMLGAAVEDLSQAIIAASDGGLAPFAIAVVEPGAVQYLVAGSARAGTTAADGSTTVLGPDPRYAWAHHLIATPQVFWLVLDASNDPATARHPHVTGFARAATIVHRLPPADLPVPPPPPSTGW
jgi:hypothetical protein